MTLDPQAKKFLDYLKSLGGAPVYKLPPDKNRRGINNLVRNTAMAPQPVARIEDRLLSVEDGTISIRIYTPAGTGPFPILVFFHGGGWMMGDLDVIDSPLRAITNSARCLVVSVAYRLAPEHKFPVAVNDCYLAASWIARNAHYFNGDEKKIAIGGESAGGNLAAAVSLMARKHSFPSLCYQVLLYPVTDCSGEYPYTGDPQNLFLKQEDCRYFEKQYFSKEEDRKNIFASPLLAEDLSGLPPALVVTAGYDLLREQGEAYARRLKEAGGEVTYYCYEEMIHGFFGFGGMMEKANSLVELIGDSLRKAFA